MVDARSCFELREKIQPKIETLVITNKNMAKLVIILHST